MGSFPYPRNGILKIDYEFILLFKKYGNPPPVSKDLKEQSKLTQEEWNQFFTGHWSFSGERQEGHLVALLGEPGETVRDRVVEHLVVGDEIGPLPGAQRGRKEPQENEQENGDHAEPWGVHPALIIAI